MAKNLKKRSVTLQRPAQRRRNRTARPADAATPDVTVLAGMRIASHAHMGMIWQSAELDLPLSSEDALTARLMREHEQWQNVWRQLAEDPDAEIERDGVNPIMHITLHGIMENQLAAAEPKDVNLVLQALLRQGMDRHEAIHLMGSVLLEEVYAVMKEQRLYDQAEYARRLWEVVEPEATND